MLPVLCSTDKGNFLARVQWSLHTQVSIQYPHRPHRSFGIYVCITDENTRQHIAVKQPVDDNKLTSSPLFRRCVHCPDVRQPSIHPMDHSLWLLRFLV